MPFTYGIDTLEPAFQDKPIPYITHGTRFHIATAQHVTNTLSATRVYLIASAGLAKATPHALKRLQDALGDKLVATRVGMSPHTHWDEVVAVAADAAPHQPDCIVTLGAGSLTDAAKVVAWMLANEVTTSAGLEEILKRQKSKDDSAVLKPSMIRTVAIPTSLSGGEYQALAGVTRDDGSNHKVGFYPPARNPSLVVLDPELVTTTPEKVWLSSGVRAVDHCVETLCSLQSNEAGDEKARDGLSKLVPALLKTKHDSADLDARFEAMMGVIGAMSAVSSGVPLGGSHAIGHQLGPLGVGHGETSCIMLPAVCKWNATQRANLDRQAACRKLLLGDPVVKDLIQNHQRQQQQTKETGKSEDQMDLGDILDLIIRALGLPRTLAEVGVGRDRLDTIAQNTMKDFWAQTNAQPLTDPKQVLEILEMVV